MTLGFAVKTILELAAILFVTYGILHEDKFIAFEQRMMKKLKRKILLYRRRKAAEIRRKNGTHLRVVPTSDRNVRYSRSGHVA